MRGGGEERKNGREGRMGGKGDLREGVRQSEERSFLSLH